MEAITLSVADYCFSLVPANEGVKIVLPERYNHFHSRRAIPQIVIKVDRGEGPDTSDMQEVFHAPWVKELNGIRMQVADRLWTVFEAAGSIYIVTTLPEGSPGESALLGIYPEKRDWNIWVRSNEPVVNPFTYPLDSLLIYYLTALNRDIFIHSSAVIFRNKGLVFSAVSGRGKTTMARLWEEAGARVIHDDRTIIHRQGERFKVSNTPVYDNETPSSADLQALFLIDHGKVNRAEPVTGKEAISRILSNSIQHGWNREFIYNLLISIESLVKSIPVYHLEFVPGPEVTEFITDILDHGARK